MSYSVVFQIRRIIFVIIMFALRSYPGIQMFTFIYSSVLHIIYLNHSRIYNERSTLYFETANECGLMIVCYHLVLFANLVHDPSMLNHIGMSMIISVGIAIGGSTLVICSISIKDQIHQLKRRWRKKKFKNNKRCRSDDIIENRQELD